MKNTKSKTAESKTQYGSLTASQDSSGDYSSKASSNAATTTAQSMQEYGTMTALQDANEDYSSAASSASSSNQNSQSNRQKQNTLTSSYDANQKP